MGLARTPGSMEPRQIDYPLNSVNPLPSPLPVLPSMAVPRPSLQLYAESLARFGGGSPYIYPLYGLGELPQVNRVPPCTAPSSMQVTSRMGTVATRLWALAHCTGPLVLSGGMI